MSIRINPLWWPFLAAATPFLTPLLLKKNKQFEKNLQYAKQENDRRLNEAKPLELPELDYIELTVLVEQKSSDGFKVDAGVSYLFRTDQGSLLFDVGFGPTTPTLGQNASRLGITLDSIDALAISHLHLDHMGGLRAARSRQVMVPEELGSPTTQSCYLPDAATAKGFECKVIDRPQILPAGIATTGPLSRSLFFLGLTEEQALVARLRNKGLVVFTGCGHPTIEVILEMVGRLSSEKIYAIGGGLHFPITTGRGNRGGIHLQRILGTGKPPWRKITDDDLSSTIRSIQRINPQKVYLSGHDSCDHTLERMENELAAETEVMRTGATYRI
jgi:7,8-dihydropterin-6-yl-methyl-4-(beta-D-ribofuranosyl)aminobenzene 5'-phosphate synthase